MLLISFCFDLNQIKILIFLYRDIFNALLKYAFSERVRMLYTDTDSLFLHFFVEGLAKEINARSHVLDAFEVCEISNSHLSNYGHGHADLHFE